MQDLDLISRTGLVAAFNRDRQLFDRQLRAGEWSTPTEAEIVTGSLICLIGLDRAGVTIDGLTPAAVFDRVVDRLGDGRQVGATGLAVWAAAVVGARVPAAPSASSGAASSGGLHDQLTTMELAWLVSGLAHGSRDTSGDQLEAGFRALVSRQASSGLMAHAGPASRLRERLRGGVANFADQVYTLQALAFASLRGVPGARAPAERLAAALQELQGPLGQWWWHYRPADGSIASCYPVYSVHQHGMAPMAFAALAAATGDERWRVPARLGREWLERNELERSLVDDGPPTIWRSVERAESPPARWLRRLRYVVGTGDDRGPLPNLRLNRETRPYEWAWQLYASAIDQRSDPGRHIV